jgi:pimeloyl-ACP methyl ester carboxylesterase
LRILQALIPDHPKELSGMIEPVVLLPGMMCDARFWWPQISHFGTRRAVHLPPMTTADTISGIAAVVLEAAPAKFALAGHYMGGAVAMEVIRRAPDRVTRLALMDTNPLSETPQVAALRDPQMARAKSGRFIEVMRDEIKPADLWPGPAQAGVLEIVMNMARSLGPDVYVRQSRAMQRRPDQQGTLRRVSVPTLVLCGEHDAICPLRRHEFMAGLIPGAVLRVIPGAGHLPTLEAPGPTIKALEEWLAAT